MTHARTLARYVGIAGLIGGLLAPVPSLAQSASGQTRVSSIAAAGRQGDDILARVAANTKPANVHSRIYWTQKVPVAAATLRRGALAALGRGVMHPGLQAAILAAGFILSENNEILVPDDSADGASQLVDDYPASDYPGSFRHYDTGGYSYYPSAYAASQAAVERACRPLTSCGFYKIIGRSDSQFWVRVKGKTSTGGTGYRDSKVEYAPSRSPNMPDVSPEGGHRPAEDEDYPALDEHIAPSLLDELVNSQDDIPEWQEAISVLPGPESAVVPTQSQNIAPEIATAVGRRGENIRAQSRGDNPPYSDAGTDGHSAEDQNREDWEQPIPPFPDVDPEWQVETIDSLPSYSIGLGGGSCPGATQIPVPFGGSITLDWQPACNLAGMLRGAVIGVCMILSLYIVLRGN